MPSGRVPNRYSGVQNARAGTSSELLKTLRKFGTLLIPASLPNATASTPLAHKLRTWFVIMATTGSMTKVIFPGFSKAGTV